MISDDHLDLAHAQALDILDAEQTRAVEELRARDDSTVVADFEDAVRQTREVLSLVAFVTAAEPSAGLRERLLAQIAGEPNVGAAGTAGPDRSGSVDPSGGSVPIDLAARRSRVSRWRVGVASVAAAAALLVGGGFAGYQLKSTAPSSTQAQASMADKVMVAPDVRVGSVAVAAGGTATAMYSKQMDAAIVTLHGVPAPRADSVYQMWFVTGSKAPLSAGILTAGKLAASPMAVVTNMGTASELAFSVEPPGGSRQPTTTPFAAITLT